MTFPSLAFTAFDFYMSESFIVEGKVKDAVSDKAIGNVHVYTVAGEEETFCGREGSFRLKTWKGLPVTVIIEHPDYCSKKIIVEDTVSKWVVQLQHK